MTRETKIGLLTGLGVIILIGVLLSEYLQGPGTDMRMANMSRYGETYRHGMQQPASVPGSEWRGGAGGTGAIDATVPMAMALDSTPAGAGPVVAAPVSAEPAGAIPNNIAERPVVLAERPADPPALFLAANESRPGTGGLVAVNTAGILGVRAPAAPVGETYTIAPRDTLTIIAKKYYHSTAKADLARIVAANPGILKDEKTPLVVGKKLVIPGVAPRGVAAVPAAVPALRAGGAAGVPLPSSALVPARAQVRLPGAVAREQAAAQPQARPEVIPARPEAPEQPVRSYSVQKGDTLEKIAKKYYGSASKEVVQRLMAANKIKDPSGLQIGMALKIPERSSPAAVRAEAPRARG